MPFNRLVRLCGQKLETRYNKGFKAKNSLSLLFILSIYQLLNFLFSEWKKIKIKNENLKVGEREKQSKRTERKNRAFWWFWISNSLRSLFAIFFIHPKLVHFHCGVMVFLASFVTWSQLKRWVMWCQNVLFLNFGFCFFVFSPCDLVVSVENFVPDSA